MLNQANDLGFMETIIGLSRGFVLTRIPAALDDPLRYKNKEKKGITLTFMAEFLQSFDEACFVRESCRRMDMLQEEYSQCFAKNVLQVLKNNWQVKGLEYITAGFFANFVQSSYLFRMVMNNSKKMDEVDSDLSQRFSLKALREIESNWEKKGLESIFATFFVYQEQIFPAKGTLKEYAKNIPQLVGEWKLGNARMRKIVSAIMLQGEEEATKKEKEEALVSWGVDLMESVLKSLV